MFHFTTRARIKYIMHVMAAYVWARGEKEGEKEREKVWERERESIELERACPTACVRVLACICVFGVCPETYLR